MGARKWHVTRAKRHKDAADFLAVGEFEDWACVALSYAAHQWVHSTLSGEPALPKDERHPRKHTAGPHPGHGGRGTNQLVNALFPDDIAECYASLFEAGRRTRYDIDLLGKDKATAYKLLEMQYANLTKYCRGINDGRDDISTQAP